MRSNNLTTKITKATQGQMVYIVVNFVPFVVYS